MTDTTKYILLGRNHINLHNTVPGLDCYFNGLVLCRVFVVVVVGFFEVKEEFLTRRCLHSFSVN